MSHINLENSRIRKSHQTAGSYANIDIVLTRDLVLTDETPTILFFDPGAVDRVITLPHIRRSGGQFFWIRNFGFANNLRVVDDLGALVVIVGPGLTSAVFSSMNHWAAQAPQGTPSESFTFNTVAVPSGTSYSAGVNDDLIIVNKSVGSATQVVMVPSATRLRGSVQIKDGKGDANVNNITIVFNGAELADGLATVPIRTSFGSVSLAPSPTGGWVILNFG